MASRSPWAHLSVAQLRARRARLVRQLPDLEATLYGALQEQMRRCGRPGCRCATGALHGPYRYLAVQGEARTRLLYVPAGAVAVVERHLAQTQRIEATLGEISALNRELLARGALG